ncbi:hypothetical protein Psch_00165 [Pelotomaculum schinkii]|uniref:Prepilin-type N-terminal cleavage/methylation domain-containing protein n=1 Tax=Pelotomaculum schinkii TaxID=78350 RepID=A0A4Y7RD22_9FIRM|nr:prepilin-type N-terminal cleavage/methylation domain-containing protein [Pelotomaculum schinkii]TEB06633.1 hypothetical protein Psch_00165 [Pelotomaculum schinkii]
MSPIEKQTPMVQNNLGFTIIEMVVAMLIISIAVAFTVPNFKKIIGAYQLDISAREMASDIRDLQQKIVKTQNTNYKVIWNIETETYLLSDGVIAYKTIKLPSGVDLFQSPVNQNNNNIPEMLFAASGRPANGFGGTVRLVDNNTGKNKYVFIDTLGRVRVSDTNY